MRHWCDSVPNLGCNPGACLCIHADVPHHLTSLVRFSYNEQCSVVRRHVYEVLRCCRWICCVPPDVVHHKRSARPAGAMPWQLLKHERYDVHGGRPVEKCNSPPACSGHWVWRELPRPCLQCRSARNFDAKLPANSHPTYVVVVNDVRRCRTDGAASSSGELGSVKNKGVETIAKPT